MKCSGLQNHTLNYTVFNYLIFFNAHFTGCGCWLKSWCFIVSCKFFTYLTEWKLPLYLFFKHVLYHLIQYTSKTKPAKDNVKFDSIFHPTGWTRKERVYKRHCSTFKWMKDAHFHCDVHCRTWHTQLLHQDMTHTMIILIVSGGSIPYMVTSTLM